VASISLFLFLGLLRARRRSRSRRLRPRIPDSRVSAITGFPTPLGKTTRPPRSQPKAPFPSSRKPSTCTVRAARRNSVSIQPAVPANCPNCWPRQRSGSSPRLKPGRWPRRCGFTSRGWSGPESARQIVLGRSRRPAHPRAGQHAGDPEGGGAGGREPLAVRRPGFNGLSASVFPRAVPGAVSRLEVQHSLELCRRVEHADDHPGVPWESGAHE